jgi:hypothetical protein
VSEALNIPEEKAACEGFVMDEAPQQLNVDTFVSQNIPSSLDVFFWVARDSREEAPFRGEIARPYDRADFFPADAIIVDNEDPGFEILGTAKQHWLSRILQNLFGIKKDDPAFSGMNILDPPASGLSRPREPGDKSSFRSPPGRGSKRSRSILRTPSRDGTSSAPLDWRPGSTGVNFLIEMTPAMCWPMP